MSTNSYQNTDNNNSFLHQNYLVNQNVQFTSQLRTKYIQLNFDVLKLKHDIIGIQKMTLRIR